MRAFFRWLGRVLNRVAALLRGLLNLVFVLMFVLILVSLFGERLPPMPEKAMLYLAPSGRLVDQRSYVDPITQVLEQSRPESAETVVSDLVKAIEAATADTRITGLVLHTDHLLGGGISKLSEVGDALLRFRASGKPVIAHGRTFTQEQYFLASHAGEIHLDPMGSVMLTGMGSYPLYYKEALDKLKITINVFRVGEYKDAIEPFTRNSMSLESREHNQAWVHALWQRYTERVEGLREAPAGLLDVLTTNLPEQVRQHQGSIARLALSLGLVDHLSDHATLHQHLTNLAGYDPETEDYRRVGLHTYLSHQQRDRALHPQPKEKIAVVTASGVIMDGLQPLGTVGSQSMRELLDQVRQDDDIRALVLRIDSPGGSAFAAEEIRRDLQRLRAEQQIPIVVSMGSLAASGGYWIAADADLIFAQPTTLTGSIGVFGIVPSFDESLNALGIHSDGISTSPLADMFHLQRPLSEPAQALIQQEVESIYHQFIELVAQGRGLEPLAVQHIAEGRVWTGQAGLEIGLVDQIGDLRTSIAAAAGLAGLEQYAVEHVTPPLSFGEQLLMQLSGAMARVGLAQPATGPPIFSQPAVQQMLTAVAIPLQELGLLNDPGGLYLRCFECGGL